MTPATSTRSARRSASATPSTCGCAGPEVVAAHGGLHRFMGWDKPILTDSGGFQVFSLGALRKITEEGVVLVADQRRKLFLTPEESMRIQHAELRHRDDLRRMHALPGHDTTRPASRCACRCAGRALARRTQPPGQPQRAVRHRPGRHVRGPARRIAGRPGRHRFPTDTPSAASRSASRRTKWRASWRTRAAPAADKPRYLMGVGTPEDLVAWRAGRDRHVRLRDADAQRAQRPPVHPLRRRQDQERRTRTIRARSTKLAAATPAAISRAPTCTHLHRVGEILGARLNTIHNLHYYQVLMRELREAIVAGTLAEMVRALPCRASRRRPGCYNSPLVFRRSPAFAYYRRPMC